VGDAIIASHIVVRRVRSLSIAVVILLVTSALWGQQPKRKSEPYIAPLLPAEQAWKILLPAPPAADAVMDDRTIYLPLEDASRTGEDDVAVTEPAVLIALARDTGETRWKEQIASHQPPVLTQSVLVVAAANVIQAFEPLQGRREWSVTLDRPVRAPMIARGPLLLAMLEGDELAAINMERRNVAWRRSIGESGPLFMTADDEAVYIATAQGRVSRLQLADGEPKWESRLEGELTEPTVDGPQLLVGSGPSGANRGSLFCLDIRTGKVKWAIRGQILGGTVIGTAVQGDAIYAVSKDNIVRKLSRKDGSQKWREPVATQREHAPRVFAGVVAVAGSSPVLSTFRADNGDKISNWPGPDVDSVLRGAPLIDNPKPRSVSIVVVFRDGQVVGLRSTGLMLKEPAVAPITALPGRPLARETLPAAPGAR
jgi:outer membrane protein assembly factor BamB